MKQLLQNLKTGEGVVADVPAPVAQRGRVIVRAAASLISAGTERAFVELGRKSLVGKAKERPDLVRKVVEKVRSEGLSGALRAVREKLNESHAHGRLHHRRKPDRAGCHYLLGLAGTLDA